MQFLGTGAAELIPNPFCTCELCNYARTHAEERRTRTSFSYDAHTMIDFGPETIQNCLRRGVSLAQLDDILYTHAHEDHFLFANMNVITMAFPECVHPFRAHLSQEAYDGLCTVRDAVYSATNGHNDLFGAVKNGYYELCPHKPFETFTLGDKMVFTVRGSHNGEYANERSMHYRITENGKTLLYALDGGLYCPESLEALAGVPLDILIMDETFGGCELPPDSGHLNAEHFVLQLENLIRIGAVTENTKVYAAHINHKSLWRHAQHQAYFDTHAPVKVTVARDGMEI